MRVSQFLWICHARFVWCVLVQEKQYEIHRDSPRFVDQSLEEEVLTTGLYYSLSIHLFLEGVLMCAVCVQASRSWT